MDILIFSTLTNLLYFCAGNIVKNEKKTDFASQFNIYFTGVILLSTISLFLNFFIKLSPFVNSIIYLLIVFFFIIKNKFYFKFDNFKFLCISSVITFYFIVFSNVNRPDAGLYHLPYISLLNENKIILGANIIHFRFALTSIIQYLSAINFNFLFGPNGISIPLASIVSFFYIYFFNDIWLVLKKKEKIDFSKFFSLFVIIYMVYKITRYSSFGNDAVAHLSFFYLVSYILKNKINFSNTKTTLLIAVFIFMNKPTMGICFLIPTFFFLYKHNFKLSRFIKILLSPASFILLIWLLKNILISGCAIYPLKITCIEHMPWIDKNEIYEVAKQGEAWSKAWPDRINKNIKIEEFNKNFNWINAWSQKHFKLIIKTVGPYLAILISIVFYIFWINKNYSATISNDLKLRIHLAIIVCIFGSISFFLLFPLYRYGYSLIISLIILILVYFIIPKIESNTNLKLFKFLFIFCFSVFLIKQNLKIIKNYSKEKWPNIYTLNLNKEINKTNKIQINKDFTYYHSVSGDFLCMYSKSPCTTYFIKDNVKHLNRFGYSILIIN